MVTIPDYLSTHGDHTRVPMVTVPDYLSTHGDCTRLLEYLW